MKNIYLLLSLLLIVSSCRDKDDGIITLSEGEAEIEMQLISTRATRAYTPTDSEIEGRIKEIDLLVFDENGVYQYSRTAYKAPSGVYRSILKVQDGIKILFFVNSRDRIESYENALVPEVTTIAQVCESFTLQNAVTTIEGEETISMWGRKDGVNISEGVVCNIGNVQLLRSVAAAELVFSMPVADFELTEVYLYNSATSTLMVPKEGATQFIAKVTQPSYPTAMTTTGNLYQYPSNIIGMKTGTLNEEYQVASGAIYMFENDGEENNPTHSPTRLVIGGKFEGGGVTYYPLDFVGKNQADKQIVLPVLRNHKYIINVLEVKSEGWSTPDEAAKSASVNMGYDVIKWDQSTDEEIHIEGPYSVSIEKRRIELYKDAGSRKNLNFSTNAPLSNIQMALRNTSGAQEIKDNDGNVIGVKNDHYSVELLFDSKKEITAIRFTALKAYDSNYKTDVLDIVVGRIELTVTINRLNEFEFGWNNGGDEDTSVGKP